METFSVEDILIDNLSFKLNKGASYINERRLCHSSRLVQIFINLRLEIAY